MVASSSTEKCCLVVFSKVRYGKELASPAWPNQGFLTDRKLLLAWVIVAKLPVMLDRISLASCWVLPKAAILMATRWPTRLSLCSIRSL